jgi:HEAT repeat protein
MKCWDINEQENVMATDAIRDLIPSLTGKDGPARKRAREQLVEIGQPAVASLLPLLLNKRTYVRWEAAKALFDGKRKTAPSGSAGVAGPPGRGPNQ